MNITHTKNHSQHKETTSLRGETPQEQGLKRRKKRTLSASQKTMRNVKRAALVAASCEAKIAIALHVAQGGDDLTVNEFLMAAYKKASGCTDFRTFAQWKSAGHTIIKGSKSFDIWGSPRKAKTAEGETDGGEQEEGREYQLFPVCSLFNEHQVKLVGSIDESQASAVLASETVPAGQERKTPDKVSVGEFRDQVRYLERVFNVDRHACVGDNEKTLWRNIAQRALIELEAMQCPRATSDDLARCTAIIKMVKAALAEGTDPTPPTPGNKREATERDTTSEPSPFVSTDYQEQQGARKDRMLQRAEKARAESQTTYNRAKDMASVIPFGQPILVGHHSEQRDRRYRDKIHTTFGKAFELDSKADHYQQKASSVGDAGIASNDPDAIEKLTRKLAGLVESQETMKAVNKIARQKNLSSDDKVAEIVNANLLSKTQAIAILKSDSVRGIGFASYSLSNNNAEIRRTRRRIAQLQRLRQSTPIQFENDDFSMGIDNGRVCVEFSGGKPSESVRALLKRSAFKWSRYQGAWVRKATANAVADAERLLGRLQAEDNIY
ncbi:MAG: DUF3560 domain-containing protein [Pseudomonadota bacterium]